MACCRLLIALGLFSFSGCSIPDFFWYTFQNPVFLAYHHELDIDKVHELAQQDTFALLLQDGGYKLYPEQVGPYYGSVWINDSLILIKVDYAICGFYEFINQRSGKVRFESRLRERRPNLIRDALVPLTDFNSKFYGMGNAIEVKSDPYAFNENAIPFEFEMSDTLMRPVDSLHWQSYVFGDTLDLQFKNGVLEGRSIFRDTTKGLVKHGFYRNGFESGEWKVTDTTGNLQWIERWKGGELQAIEYTEKSHLKREKRLPTLKETIFLHRLIVYAFVLVTILVLYHYIKSFRSFIWPYRNKNAYQIIGMIILTPVISIGTSLVALIFMLLIIAFLQTLLGWDLPSYLYCFWIIPYYSIVGCFYFIINFRMQDIFWHAALLACALVIYGELDYLGSLHIGVF